MAASDKSGRQPDHPRLPLPARRTSTGFTLVEVLAALVIVSLGMLGVIQAVSQTASNGAYVRDRTVAHWIAMNRVTEVRLEPQAPTIGTDSDDVEMAGRKWRWSMEVTQTAVESIRRIDVEVALADAKDKPLAFVSGFYGTAIDQTNSAAMLWPGGELPGGAGGQVPGKKPGDPNDPPTDLPQPNPEQDPGTIPGGSSPPKPEPEPPPPDPGDPQ